MYIYNKKPVLYATSSIFPYAECGQCNFLQRSDHHGVARLTSQTLYVEVEGFDSSPVIISLLTILFGDPHLTVPQFTPSFFFFFVDRSSAHEPLYQNKPHDKGT